MHIGFAQLLPYRTTIDPIYLVPVTILILGFIALRSYNRYRESKIRQVKKQTVHPPEKDITTAMLSQRPDKKELKQISLYFALTAEQADFFTVLCTRYRISNPARLFHNHTQLEEIFSKAFKELQAVSPPTRESEHDKTMLFTIREAIDNRKRSGKLISSTRLLQGGQEFTLITNSGEQYPSNLLENLSGGLLCTIPRDSFNNELRLPLWSKIRILFYSGNGQSYQLQARILKYDSGDSVTRMLLSHSDSIEAMPNRHHDRKSFKTECTFTSVKVANVVNGNKTEHKFYPSAKYLGGIIMDISVGGCSIQTMNPFNIGEYIQILCILHKSIEETIIGKVIRMTKDDKGLESMMHIQFAKMPRATMNRIFSYIYNYGENIQ